MPCFTISKGKKMGKEKTWFYYKKNNVQVSK